MSSTPFRFVQRRTTVTGRIPELTGLLTGEFYLQLADGTIYFKNAAGNALHTVITDASGFGLNKVKFSGANSGDFPFWNGSEFIPFSIDNFLTTGQTGSFLTTGQTGSFLTTGQTGNFGNANAILNSGYGLNSIQQSGANNNSSGNYSVSIGSGNIAEKDFSFALGKQAKTSQFGEFAFSNGSFSEKGDSQYSFVMARATTTNSNTTFLKINNSDKIVELDLGETVFFTANVVGAGGDKYISNEIRGVIKRSAPAGSQISFLNAPSKSIYALYPNGSAYSVNISLSTSDNSLKIECVGDAIEKMIWFAKIDLIKIKESKNVYFYPTIDGDWFSSGNWYSDENFSNQTNLPVNESIVYVNFPDANGQPFVNIDNQAWVTPEVINTLNVVNESGLKVISNSGSEFTGTVIGNVTFEGANPASLTENLYFSGVNNINWYDQNNWFITEFFKTKAPLIPSGNNNAYIYGYSGACVNIDSGSWITPKLINTQNVTIESGIIIKSNIDNEFTGIIIGNSTFEGAHPVSLGENLYFSGVTGINWYDQNNWFLSSFFKTKSNQIPDETRNAYVYGYSGACVDIDNAYWIPPKLINTENVTIESGIIIKSSIQKEFSGIIIGNSTFEGAIPVTISDNLYFMGVSGVSWYDQNNWFTNDSFSRAASHIPNENNTVYMYGETGAYVNIDNSNWQTPKLINTQNVIDACGICIISATGKLFTGIIVGNSSFSGASPFTLSDNLYFMAASGVNWYDKNNWFTNNYFSKTASHIPTQSTNAYMYGSTGAYVDIDDSSWQTPKLINTENVTDASGICIISQNSKLFTGVIIGNSSFSGASPFSLSGNLYFSGVTGVNWYDQNNWFVNNSFIIKAPLIPTQSNNAYMHGSTGAYVNIDSPNWQTPKLINTENVIDASGICILSTTGKLFTGIIIGNSSFSGASPSYV